MKKLLKVVVCVILVVVLAAAALIGWLSLTEYRPAAQETLPFLTDHANEDLQAGEDLSILSFFILSFDKLPEPLEPKHIHVCLTADDGKVYDFETLLTFQELDYHSSTY